MTPHRCGFYQIHATLMEPWDRPALIAFTDGSVIGAVLDRNGLRPGRYWVTSDGLVILTPMVRAGSEPIGSMGTDTPLAVLSDGAAATSPSCSPR